MTDNTDDATEVAIDIHDYFGTPNITDPELGTLTGALTKVLEKLKESDHQGGSNVLARFILVLHEEIDRRAGQERRHVLN